MKIIFAVVCLIGLTVGSPAGPAKEYKDIQNVAHDFTLEDNGKFHYSFENDDGTKAVQDGELKVIDKDVAGESVRGSFSYPDGDGNVISLTYTADENGYQPVGDHLPVAPPVPEIIQRALAYLATAPPPKE